MGGAASKKLKDKKLAAEAAGVQLGKGKLGLRKKEKVLRTEAEKKAVLKSLAKQAKEKKKK